MSMLSKVFVIKEKAREDLAEAGGYGFEEAMELDDISPQEAKKEIACHEADWNEFVRDVGNKPKYTGQEVLGWLGY